jgi:uncharacterized protein involved in cysteine biosynthesis
MPIPSGPVARAGAGALLPLRAARLLVARRELRALAAAPAALTLLGIVAGLCVAGPAATALLSLAWARPERLGPAVAWWLAWGTLLLAILYLSAVALPVALAAPFADRLSARVEELELGGIEGGGLARAVREGAVGAAHSLARVAILAAGYAVAAPALLVPGAFPVLAFLWTAAWSAFEWLDLPMARHLHGFGEVRAALRAVRPLGLGFGAVLGLLFLVPFANLVVIPIGAVGGTLLYCDLVRDGRVARGGSPPYAPPLGDPSRPRQPPGRPTE